MAVRKITGSLLLCVLYVAIGGSAKLLAEEQKDDLPIRRVVMFSSGVSFFEHRAEIAGNDTVDLKFRVDDINDLLKSMVLQDLGGGRISTVSYGSKDPITRTLKTFAIDLTQNPTLADLLGQIRGEKIEIEAPDKVVGTILGVERRKQQGEGETIVETDYINLLTEVGLRSLPLDRVGRIKLANPKLDAELRQALTVLASGHDVDKKTVTLSFLGEGKRPVRVGYVQESPIWKTSYRLVLDEEDPRLLQGWAIVENTTDMDWQDVNLTLVSGRPISFVMDLYEPLYVARPEVKPELYASLMPKTYDQDLASAEADFRAAGKYKEAEQLKQLADRKAQFGYNGRPADEYAKRDLDYLAGPGKSDAAGWGGNAGVKSVAQAGDVGELFRYAIATPVSLERNKSAMLPIVNESVEGEKVSIYNADTHEKHPLNGLRLKNSTDLHLMQGPITVFDGGAYAGDAQIQDLPPKSERLISYALDLDTEVASTYDSKPRTLVSCRLAKGTLYSTHKQIREHHYVIKNSGKKEKNVLLEQPLDTNWKLVAPEEPAEKTRDLYRFSVKAEPGKPANLEVKEETTLHESVAINNLNDDTIRYYLHAEVVSEKVKQALQEVIKRKQAIAAVVREKQEHERQIGIIGQEQARIRGNMEQLPKDSDLFRRYIQKFAEQEDSMEALREKVTAAVQQEEKLRKELDAYLLGLEIQ